MIKKMLLNEKRELEKIVSETLLRLKESPGGTLRISKKSNRIEYYCKKDGENSKENGRYIRQDEFELVKRLAQKDYDKRILEKAEKRIKMIGRFLKQYEESDLQGVYEHTNELRRKIIAPSKLPDNEYVKRWLAVSYTGKSFVEGAPEIYTEKGERVRSKSEKIIADKLYLLGIPYRYEYPLLLEGNITVYPDFTILQVKKRKEIYLEHFGKMDDYEYMEKVVFKLQNYERNGIYLGGRLFCTLETEKRPLNVRCLDDFIKKVIM